MVGPSALLVLFYCTYCGVTGWLAPAMAPRPPQTPGAGSAMSAFAIVRSLALPIGLVVAILLFVTVGWVPLGEWPPWAPVERW